jgi:hypothetical protein
MNPLQGIPSTRLVNFSFGDRAAICLAYTLYQGLGFAQPGAAAQVI